MLVQPHIICATCLQAYTPGVGDGTGYPPPNPTFPLQPPYGGYPATSPAMPPNTV